MIHHAEKWSDEEAPIIKHELGMLGTPRYTQRDSLKKYYAGNSENS